MAKISCKHIHFHAHWINSNWTRQNTRTHTHAPRFHFCRSQNHCYDSFKSDWDFSRFLIPTKTTERKRSLMYSVRVRKWMFIWRRIGNNWNEIQWLRDQINPIKCLSKMTVHLCPHSRSHDLSCRSNWVPTLVVTSFKFICLLKSLLMTCVCVCYTTNVRFRFIRIMCFTLTISFARALSGVKVDDNHDLIEQNQANIWVCYGKCVHTHISTHLNVCKAAHARIETNKKHWDIKWEGEKKKRAKKTSRN